MRDLFTPQSHACWHERIRKETAARVAWRIKHSHETRKEGPMQRKQLQKAPLRATVEACSSRLAPKSKRVSVECPGTRRDQGTPPWASRVREVQRAPQKPVSRPSPSEGLEMRKVPASTRQLLLQGRSTYLLERYRQKPEEKFPYPILSSWEYGWHVGDFVKNVGPPAYARCNPITKSFCIRSSVFHLLQTPDPLM